MSQIRALASARSRAWRPEAAFHGEKKVLTNEGARLVAIDGVSGPQVVSANNPRPAGLFTKALRYASHASIPEGHD